ncbi:hypothetical protein LOK74_09590 [Brevibacillus humidisoli]|uniref:hypothetical protein n=1 Tax=Brevibacillus humidisoli TaxID=2895522 RepID=UPI001E5256AF|nr:hypothetical protein [Brevibacillus humidisoli]UFJ42720.1 hypothetical protein LOK74_09590 [Brevibacillus humidisoli]
MGLLYETVMKIKNKKPNETIVRKLSPSLSEMTLQRITRTVGSRTAPLNLPGWLVK